MAPKTKVSRQKIRGLDFPCSDDFTEERILSALDYKPTDKDIIISTYPKSGTTWLQYIVYEILNKGKPPPAMAEMQKIMPYMEARGSSAVETLDSPRVLKYHIPFNLLPQNPKTKYLTVIRNPSDVLISYYHFLKQITSVDLPFEDFYEEFVEGECVYGDYFDHVLSWYKHREDKTVLVLLYEEMKSNPLQALHKIADFIGHNLNEDDNLVKKILEHTSFEYMKAHAQFLKKGDKNLLGEISKEDGKDKVNFFRTGTVGDGKVYLTESQKIRLNKRMAEKLQSTDLLKYWSDTL